jgi:tol-pal system protein YbgF
MFRQPLPPRAALLAAACGLARAAAPPSAWSQDRSTQERLERLERDLNMLQRQVYRGGPPQVIGGDGGGAASAQIRMDRVEAQMRDLTGHVEEVSNQLEQLRQRMEQINTDLDLRIGSGGVGGGALAAVPPGKPAAPPPRSRQFAGEQPPPPDDDPLRRPGFPLPPGAAVGPPPGGPGPVYGTLTPPGAPPQELASVAPPARPPAGEALPSGTTTEQYNYAFGLLKQADYPAAEAALKAFVEQHPKDPMAGNAQYWLGETYYTRNRFLEAASAFAEGYKRYPKSAKAAEDLLKLGMSLSRANQKQNACLAFAQLDRDFPSPGASIRDRAATEKKHLGC